MVAGVVREVVPLVDANAARDLIEFEPLPRALAAGAVHGNAWRSTRQMDHQKLVALRKSIASKLVEKDGFVVFHFDADCVWGDLPTCVTAQQFDVQIRGPVAELLRGHRAKNRMGEDLDAMLGKLITLVPAWCIESWLLQNTRVGRRECENRCGGGHIAIIDAWSADRTALDDIRNPADLVCFGKHRNEALICDSFPAREVERAGRSFAVAVRKFRSCASFLSALIATHQAGLG